MKYLIYKGVIVMSKNQEFENISLKPIQDKIKKTIQSMLVSIVITDQNLKPMKWIPIDENKIESDMHYFSKTSLTTLIEEHYISIKYLTSTKVFLGITDSNASFTIYQELPLCAN